MSARAVVVGGGVGGLAAAIHLARAGLAVRVYERAPVVGGKLCEVELGERRLAAGPTVLTMPALFDELFEGRIGEYVRLLPLEPLCRHFFADGTRLDLYCEAERSAAEIERLCGAAEARAYLAFRRRAARIYDIVHGPFMEQPLPAAFDFLSPRKLWQLTQIDGMRTLWKALESDFHDPRLRQLFGRYATYNGSSPYHAPATLAVIAHVENAFGAYTCAGGIVRLAEALARRAAELGVEIETGVEVDELLLAKRGGEARVRGVRVRGAEVAAEVVVANCDVAALDGLLGRPASARSAADERSLSAYVLLALAPASPLDLAHHNVFFSADYRREFDELLQARRPPEEPTVYVCAADRVPDGGPMGRERYFCLTNAPPLLGARKGERKDDLDWQKEAPRCRARIERILARHGWTLAPEAAAELTPAGFAERFPSSQGALYGLSSNSRLAAFRRPANRVAGVRGLYAAGGSAHPGAGLPMVALSGRIAARLALEELRS